MEKEKEENIIEKEKLSRVERQHGTEIEGSTRGPHGPKKSNNKLTITWGGVWGGQRLRSA